MKGSKKNMNTLFDKAPEDRKFMEMYYNGITNSSHFKKVLKSGVRSTGKLHQQEFESEIQKTWNLYLYETGRATPEEAAVLDKGSLFASVMSTLEDGDFETRVLDTAKSIGAIRYKDFDYEIRVTKHKKPQVSEVSVGKKLNDYINPLVERLSEEYSIMKVQNSIITMEDNDGNQTSVKFGKKKVKLF